MNRGCDCPPYDCAARVSAYLAQDRDAGADLIVRFRPLVFRIVQRVLADYRDEWDDATQEAMLHILERVRYWRRECPFCKFLAVVVAKKAIDYRRHLRVLSNLPEVILDPRPNDPAELLLDLQECVEAKLSLLPKDRVRAWELHIAGQTGDEAARTLGVSVRTFHYWLAHVRSKLVSCLGE